MENLKLQTASQTEAMNRTHQTSAIRRRDFFTKFGLMALLPATLAATPKLRAAQSTAARQPTMRPGRPVESPAGYTQRYYDSKGRLIKTVTEQ